MLKNKNIKAIEVLNKLYNENEVDQIKSDIELSINSSPYNVSLFNVKFRKSLMLGLILAVLVQMVGTNAALDYAPKIMMSAGLSIDSALFFNIFMGVINLAATVVGVILIDKLGRRALYLYGSIIMGITLFFLGFSFHHKMPTLLTLTFLFSYIACFSACIGPVFWTLVSEIFPNSIRGKAIALVSFTQWIFNFLVVWLFPYALSTFGGDNTFYFFSAICLIQLFVSKYKLPETKGKTLEEIEKIWN